VLNQKAVKVIYHSASKGREVISEFHPYGMVLLHASLYCIGYLACYEEVRTLKVSRIKGLTSLSKTFEKPEDFSLAGHFHGAFGIFRADKKQKIRAEFTGWAATNLREIQWHPSQKILKDNGKGQAEGKGKGDSCGQGPKVVATFNLGSTVEFKRWLLGFGKHARIVSPKSLANDLRDEIKSALAKY
ncbi:MAG TPA: WYL domain-containing protein, partial [Phycisphaerae bacterium]|nr:WYL domain-containing protein [Phycisphaerae bacterium]